jgi:uncharacterized protein (DUF1800 family)
VIIQVDSLQHDIARETTSIMSETTDPQSKRSQKIIAIDFANKSLPRVARSTAGIEPYAGVWDTPQMLHLLRRTLCGVSKQDWDLIKTKTLSDAVDYLLTVPAMPPDPPLNVSTLEASIPLGQTWVNSLFAQVDPNDSRVPQVNVFSVRQYSLKSWWLGLMINQSTSILEKMTLFLANHFSTEVNGIQDARASYKQYALLRQNALGNFKNLVLSISQDPAMLVYLNGRSNTKAAPDENYGRELQELFTVGKGPDSLYTEDDVKAAARVLTGWQFTSDTLITSFNLSRHDTTNKQFSSFYNSTIIAGRNDANAGINELNDLINMIFAQTEVAKFICRKLYRWFVYYVIDDTVEQNVITPLANIFRSNNYEIKPVLAVLLKSAHFFDPINIGCMIKSPIDFLAGHCRQFMLGFPTSSQLQAQYTMWDYIRGQASNMDQNIGDPPNVAGWQAYYQEPQFYELWINSDTLPKRAQFTDTMISTNGYKNGSNTLKIDPIAFASQFSNPSDPNALIDDLSQFLYPAILTDDKITLVTLDDTQKSALKSILLSGQISDSYWTSAWITYQSDITNTTNRNIVVARLQSLLKTMMSQVGFSEYYQLS